MFPFRYARALVLSRGFREFRWFLLWDEGFRGGLGGLGGLGGGEGV